MKTFKNLNPKCQNESTHQLIPKVNSYKDQIKKGI